MKVITTIILLLILTGNPDPTLSKIKLPITTLKPQKRTFEYIGIQQSLIVATYLIILLALSRLNRKD
jgi:hypothetical protein